MQKIPALVGAALLCLSLTAAHAQSIDSAATKILNFPARLFGRIQSRTESLDQQLTQQTEKMLKKMAQKETQMERKLSGTDSVGAKQLFASSQQEYASLLQRLNAPPANHAATVTGQYQPYVDSLQGSLAFLKQNPQLLQTNPANLPPELSSQLQSATNSLQAMQSKLQVAAQAKVFVQQRKQLISQYITQHAKVQSLLSKPYSAMNQGIYYYSQRLQQYKDMLNSPDKLEKQALARLSGLPAFQTFMKNNSQLSGLFKIPGTSAGTGAASRCPDSKPMPRSPNRYKAR